MSNIVDDIIRLGEDLAQERSLAADLWTWLPSYRAAHRVHGDRGAMNFMPCVADIMREASLYIAHGLNPTAEQIGEAGDFYLCPCGECETGYVPPSGD